MCGEELMFLGVETGPDHLLEQATRNRPLREGGRVAKRYTQQFEKLLPPQDCGFKSRRAYHPPIW